MFSKISKHTFQKLKNFKQLKKTKPIFSLNKKINNVSKFKKFKLTRNFSSSSNNNDDDKVIHKLTKEEIDEIWKSQEADKLGLDKNLISPYIEGKDELNSGVDEEEKVLNFLKRVLPKTEKLEPDELAKLIRKYVDGDNLEGTVPDEYRSVIIKVINNLDDETLEEALKRNKGKTKLAVDYKVEMEKERKRLEEFYKKRKKVETPVSFEKDDLPVLSQTQESPKPLFLRNFEDVDTILTSDERDEIFATDGVYIKRGTKYSDLTNVQRRSLNQYRTKQVFEEMSHHHEFFIDENDQDHPIDVIADLPKGQIRQWKDNVYFRYHDDGEIVVYPFMASTLEHVVPDPCPLHLFDNDLPIIKEVTE